MKESVSNPLLLVFAGILIFLLPRLFRFLTIISLLSVGVVGLLAKSEKSPAGSSLAAE